MKGIKKCYSYLFFLVLITTYSCGNNCEEISNSFDNYNQAKEVVLSSNFKLAEDADVSGSSWISSAKYFSCDGLTGFFIIETDNRTYIHQNMPYSVWENFKNANSKGSFYSKTIRGNYQLKLN